MNKSFPTLEQVSEQEVLHRLAQADSSRIFWTQLLRENPSTRKFVDKRTLENLGLDRYEEQ